MPPMPRFETLQGDRVHGSFLLVPADPLTTRARSGRHGNSCGSRIKSSSGDHETGRSTGARTDVDVEFPGRACSLAGTGRPATAGVPTRDPTDGNAVVRGGGCVLAHPSRRGDFMSGERLDGTTAVTEREAAQVERANASGLPPVVFVHGLWLLPSSWDRWAELFETAGYVALTPGWPDDPETVAQASAHPEVFAHKSIGQVADHFAAIVGSLAEKPAIMGHSFGGLLAQILAGRGLAAVSVAIDPAPFRGVLPL